MYFKKKNNKSSSEVNLAPLIDVLTCTVGIMLFVVIFAVLAARGASIKYLTPLQKEPPANSEKRLFICKKGRIKPFSIKSALDSLLANSKATYKNIPTLIARANAKNIHDLFYTYSFSYDDYIEGDWFNYSRIRVVSITIHELDSLGGDNADQIQLNNSRFANFMSSIDSAHNWIAFALCDEESIEVFRTARNIVIKKGIPNGWDPSKIKFPLVIPLIGSDSPDDFGIPQ